LIDRRFNASGKKMNWEATLRTELKSLHETFEAGELAYLTLTSKSEHAIRDRLTFRLQKRLQDQDLVVAREWKRVDIAVLNLDGEPQCLLELKFNLSCDIANQTRKCVVTVGLETDRTKLQEANTKHTECSSFQLLLLMRPSSPPDLGQSKYLKYGARLRQDHVKDSETLEKLVREKCSLNQTGQWPQDAAFGIDVNMHYWLFQPKLTY
jgi:hypothetical protein